MEQRKQDEWKILIFSTIMKILLQGPPRNVPKVTMNSLKGSSKKFYLRNEKNHLKSFVSLNFAEADLLWQMSLELWLFKKVGEFWNMALKFYNRNETKFYTMAYLAPALMGRDQYRYWTHHKCSDLKVPHLIPVDHVFRENTW